MARMLVRAYVISAVVLSAVTLACYEGWLWPASWATSGWPTQRLLLEYRAGMPMRMAAASSDFNQGAMTILVAFVASLYVFSAAPMRAWQRLVLITCQAAMAGALLVSMSRTALVIAAGAVMIHLIKKGMGARFRKSLVIPALIFFSLGAVILSGDLTQVLLHRAQGGWMHDDPSIRGRGTGLSDSVGAGAQVCVARVRTGRG